MVSLNARFSLLATLCTIAALSMHPLTVAEAAVLQSRHSHAQNSSYDGLALGETYSSHSQRFFPVPGRRGGEHQVRMTYYSPSGPLSRFVDGALSQFKMLYFSRSIVIPNNQGSSYVVAHSEGDARHSRQSWRRPLARRADATGADGTLGSVAIMSHSDNGADRQIGSLAVDRGVVGASDSPNGTLVRLVNAQASPSGGPAATSSKDDTPVNVQVPAGGGNKAQCLSYNPTKAETMATEDCANSSVGSSSVNTAEHRSQIFLYNSKTGNIRPTWFAGEDDGKTDETTKPASNRNTTSSINGTDSSPTMQAAVIATRQNHRNQNVTLVFVPQSTSPQAAAAAVESPSNSSSVLIETMTTTVTVTSTGSATLQAATASITPSMTSSASSSDPSSTPSAGGLEVQLVGNGESSSSSVPASSVSSTSAIASPAAASSSAMPSTTINAAAIASDLASSLAASLASSASASSSGSATSTAAVNSGSSMPSVVPRDRNVAAAGVTPVSTDPYEWKFKADGR